MLPSLSSFIMVFVSALLCLILFPPLVLISSYIEFHD